MSIPSAWLTRAALLVYCLWSVLLIVADPGLNYDEALLVLGAVQMRHSPREIPLPHDPNTWVCIDQRCLPLMTARYVGAIKEYLCLPVFAVFGPSAEAVRAVSALLGLLGIWGLARLIACVVNPGAAAVVAWLLALNPSYVDFTVFDQGTVSIWMGVFGALCAAIAHYLKVKTAPAALIGGVFVGLGIWARANFLWLVLAMLLACLLVWRLKMLRPLTHWAALAAGALVGGSPFLWYQIVSHGGTWEAVNMFSSGAGSLYVRLVMLSETLLSDREHRAIWDGPMMPDWQRWLFPSIVLAACFVCLWKGSKFSKCAVLTFLFLGGEFFASRLPVSEHHLVTLLPIAAVIVALAAQRVMKQAIQPLPDSRGSVAIFSEPRPSGSGPEVPVASALALVYAGCAIFWQISAIQGIQRTGGVGQWSDGIFTLTDVLEQRFRHRDIAILDWGLQNSLFVLSDGRIQSHEMYWGPGETPPYSAASWGRLLQQGGIFLINGPTNRMMPDATNLFLSEIEKQRPVTHKVVVPQESGAAYAEIIEVIPNTVGQGDRPHITPP